GRGRASRDGGARLTPAARWSRLCPERTDAKTGAHERPRRCHRSTRDRHEQDTSGLKGVKTPLGLSRCTQTCRLQCGTGTGVPPTSNGWPSKVGAGCPTSMTMYSTAASRGVPWASGAYTNASGWSGSKTGSTSALFTQWNPIPPRVGWAMHGEETTWPALVACEGECDGKSGGSG